ncbi:hypothetical protein M199_gp211 [Halogranum tailed virus 1]|uniref:Uncharacterized protein n=1 Tax=Halogranum tailed virus 1 TaxID=1273749 RepID=R4T976_9CAUD|nr:hypothetical protein M199_gp211 [Halogranum tailed virus 1]AGM11455.1 hypothetical protein HGTV1_158 [Halogranum tailed virus 1]
MANKRIEAQVEKHMQKIHEALKEGDEETARKHGHQILLITGYYDE